MAINRNWNPQWNLAGNTPVSSNNIPNSSDLAWRDVMSQNSTFNTLANELKGMSAKYNEQMDKFSTQYEGLMNDLLAKKNKYTGNIFKDFITDYKDARESGIGSGVRDSIMDMFGKYSVLTRALMSYDIGKSDITPQGMDSDYSFNFTDPTGMPSGYGR